MSNQIGDAQSARDEEDREGELLCLKIKEQLEDLFSDSHLAQDGFLLKHVQRNKLGYVSLKLLTCLKKIRVLTKKWHVTLAAAARSEVLELNDECTKVRRIEPLPEWLLRSPTSRLLLVWNIPAEDIQEDGAAQGPQHSSLSERIHQKFSAHGSITSVWILHPGKELRKELQCYAKRNKELGQHLCAVVKFDHFEAVRKAYSALTAEKERSSSEGMCVRPLGVQSMHHITEDKPSKESQEDSLEIFKDCIQEETLLQDKVSDETPDTSQPQESSTPNSMQRTSGQIFPNSCGQSLSGFNQRGSRISWCSGDCDRGGFQSPWVLQRKIQASALKVGGHLNASCLMVLHQPFGPDGTRGFAGRRKPLQRQTLPKWRRAACAEQQRQILGATTY